MATNFPGSLDAFTNPSSTDTLDNPPHDQQHADVNDAVEALQAKVGVDSSADTNSLDYKVANFTNKLGSGAAVRTLGTFVGGDVLQAAELNQLNSVTSLGLTSILNVPTGAGTAVLFGAGTEQIDVSGWHSTTSNTERVTPNVEGWYLCSWSAWWNETALNTYIVNLRKNGSTIRDLIIYGDFYPAGGNSAVVYLNGTTDYVSLHAQTTSGVTRQLYRCDLTVLLLRKA